MVSLPQHKDWKQETVKKKKSKNCKNELWFDGGLYAIVEAQITLPPGCSF